MVKPLNVYSTSELLEQKFFTLLSSLTCESHFRNRGSITMIIADIRYHVFIFYSYVYIYCLRTTAEMI